MGVQTVKDVLFCLDCAHSNAPLLWQAKWDQAWKQWHLLLHVLNLYEASNLGQTWGLTQLVKQKSYHSHEAFAKDIFACKRLRTKALLSVWWLEDSQFFSPFLKVLIFRVLKLQQFSHTSATLYTNKLLAKKSVCIYCLSYSNMQIVNPE